MEKKLFVPGGVDLVGVRLIFKRDIKNTFKVWENTDPKIEKLLKQSNFFEKVPFWWIGFIYRYGIKNKLVPDYKRISKKYGDLPIAIELRADILSWADQNNVHLLEDIFMVGALEALIHVGHKYKLPTEALEKEREKYNDIPETVEECECLDRLLKL